MFSRKKCLSELGIHSALLALTKLLCHQVFISPISIAFYFTKE